MRGIRVPEANGWLQWGKHVLEELKRLSDNCDSTQSELADYKVSHAEEHADIKADIRELQVKAAAWGALAGAIPAAIAIVWNIVK